MGRGAGVVSGFRYFVLHIAFVVIRRGPCHLLDSEAAPHVWNRKVETLSITRDEHGNWNG